MNGAPVVDIDFGRPAAARGGAGAVLLVLGIGAAAAGVMWHVQSAGALEDIEARTADVQRMKRRTAAGMPDEPGPAREVQQEVQAANAVIRRMTVPWDRLFGELTPGTGEHVALLAVEPDAQSRQIRISGEARNLPAVLAYARRLESGMLRKVVLVSHEIRTRDPQRPVAFTMSAEWSAQP